MYCCQGIVNNPSFEDSFQRSNYKNDTFFCKIEFVMHRIDFQVVIPNTPGSKMSTYKRFKTKTFVIEFVYMSQNISPLFV